MRHKQQGGSLIFVLVLLTVMLMGSVSMLRTTSTSNDIASNVAFKQAATFAAQAGVDAAAVLLRDVEDPESATEGYYPAKEGDAATGLPSVDWDEIPVTTVSAPDGVAYSVQFVVERLCSESPVTDALEQCSIPYGEKKAGSARVGAADFSVGEGFFYRATVRVTGPKRTESFVQAIFSR